MGFGKTLSSFQEINRLFYKDFDYTGAINQMIKTDPHLKWSLDQAKRASLFKALGLVVRNTSLDLPQIVVTLTPFCRYDPVFASRGYHVKATVSLGPPSSQATSTPPDYQPPSNFQGNTAQTDEEHVYTSALKNLRDSEYCLPTYNLTQSCYSPARWEAIAQYKGVKSSAEASSKKAAKHSASKALWLQLGNSTLL
jgi:hypothetical protein